MREIAADYRERIIIGPEDVIPKSSMFKFVKCSLVVALSMLIVLAVVTLIVAESFVSHKYKDGLAIGIVSLVGIILFSVGIIAILKEHIPLVLTFSVSMILFLLLCMYSRVITSPGMILLRTIVLILLSIESFCFCIMIRDWRAIQISRLNQRLMKEAQLMQYAQANGLPIPGGYSHHQHQFAPGASHHLYGQPMRPGAHGYQAHQQQSMYNMHPDPSRAAYFARTGYPEEMHQYATPNLNRSQFGHQQQQRQQTQSQYGVRQQQQQYGPNQPHHGPSLYDQNPYITVEEEENPYAQIGEPTRRGNASGGAGGHIYTQTRVSQPRRY